MTDAEPKRRGRIVLKSTRRNGYQSDVSDPPNTSTKQSPSHTEHLWAAPVTKSANGDLEKVISTRNQLKKELFGDTLVQEWKPLRTYPVYSTPLQSDHSNRHTLNTFSLSRYSSSSEYDEPHSSTTRPNHDFKASTVPLLDPYEFSQPTRNHSRVRSPQYNDWTNHHMHSNGRGRAFSGSPVLSDSTDSSPLHRPLRVQSADNLLKRKAKSRLKRNQVAPNTHHNTHLPHRPTSHPHEHSAHFDEPDFRRTIRHQTIQSANTAVPTLELTSTQDRGDLESTAGQRQRLASTADSLSTTLSIALTPLLTSELRKGGRKPSEDICFDFDAEVQLESCFPSRQMQVFIVTWNMQEQKLLPDSLDDLLLPLSQETAADLFVVGTQESTPSRREWEVLLQQTLGPSYVLVQSASLGVIYLTVYLRRDLIWFCSAVQCSTFATRLGSRIKTKGGVGVSFTLFGTSFLFITSHLTAHKHKVQERNADVLKIAANLTLCPDSSDKGFVLNKYDHVFWFGDLNYRVDTSRDQADQCVTTADWMALLLKDQLTREVLQGNVFHGFSEQPISFPPSYKFDTNTDVYDSSEKKRVPSWTDRILFKSLKGSGINGCVYNSCSSIRISDHRPVYAVFRVALEPSKQLDGVPDTIVNFDRTTYTQAQQRRKQLAEELAVQRTPTEEQDAPKSNSTLSKHVTSSVCVIL